MMSLSFTNSLVPSLSSEFSSSLLDSSSIDTTPSASSTLRDVNNNNGNSSNGNGTGPPGVQGSSTLLFGFLFTFLALFVGFVTCGYSSRRAQSLLRGAREGQVRRRLKWKKPRMWDVWIPDVEKTTDEKKLVDIDCLTARKWEDIRKPLSAAQISNKSRLRKASSDSSTHSALRYLDQDILGTTMFYFRTRRTRTFMDIDPLFTLDENNNHHPRPSLTASTWGPGRPSRNHNNHQSHTSVQSPITRTDNDSKDVSETDEKKGIANSSQKKKDLQVAVLIAMPNPSKPVFLHKQHDVPLKYSDRTIEEVDRDQSRISTVINVNPGPCIRESEGRVFDIGLVRVPFDSRELGRIQNS